MPPSDEALVIERTLRIRATPNRVLAAFFDAADLTAWWGASRSVTVPRSLGPYVIEWPPTAFEDDVIGKLGGTLHGTVMDVRDGASFFLADLHYLPPVGAPIGPMALAVRTRPIEGGRSTELVVRQSATDEGPRWQRYFLLMAEGWDEALEALREHLEWSGVRARRGTP